ncbi:MAG: hypothetical protein J5804_06130 [Eggerthellaceae bacterium]|nr:hypothetical protein [Eggerthellaceae bacterium]
MKEGIILNSVSEQTMAIALACAIVVGLAVFAAVARPRALFGSSRTGGSSGRKLGLFLALFAATGVLIFPLLLRIQSGNAITTIPLLGVRLLQAVVLDNGYVDYIGGLPEGGMATLYYCLIGFAYIALPLVGAMNVYDLIMQNLSNLSTAYTVNWKCRGRDVYLISDFNANTYGLARDVLARDDRALLVFGAMSKLERNRWSTEISRLGADQVRCFETDYSDLAVRFCRSFRFDTLKCFAFSGHCEQDVAQTCRALRALRAHDADAGKHDACAFVGPDAQDKVARVQLYVASDSVDDQIVLDVANGKGSASDEVPSLRLVVVNEATMAIYDLLYRAPLHCVLDSEEVTTGGIRPHGPTDLAVLIVGSGRYAEEALKAVLWYGQMHNVALEVDVAAPDAHEMRNRVFARYPELALGERFLLQFTEVPILSPELDSSYLEGYARNQHLYVIVALEDDALSFEVAMHVRMYYLGRSQVRRRDVDKHPFIACLVRNEATSSLVASQFDGGVSGYGLLPFGCSRKLFGYDGILDSPLEHAGQAAADLYDALWSGIQGYGFACDDVDVASLKDAVRASVAALGDDALTGDGPRAGGGIACMPQIRHHSNLALALHARYKAWALGWEPGRADIALDASDATCLALGRSEHDRWTVFYQTQGFTYLPPEQQEYLSRMLGGQNDRHKVEPLRKHTLICPNDQIWANYLHAVGGFAYQEESDVSTGGTQVSVRAIGQGSAFPPPSWVDGNESTESDSGQGDVANGVGLQLLDDQYRVIEAWEATDEVHITRGLPNGAYVVHPTLALPGLECAQDVHFEIHEGHVSVDRTNVDTVDVDVAGKPLVNPVIYDWAFAFAAPYLVR